MGQQASVFSAISILKSSFFIATLSGLGYFVALIFTNLLGGTYSVMVSAVLAVAIIISAVWTALSLHIKSNGKATFLQKLPACLATILIMAFYVAISNYAFYSAIVPEYHENYKQYYLENTRLDRFDVLYKKRINNSEDDISTYTFTAEDTAIVDKSIVEYMKKPMVQYQFTTMGQVNFKFFAALILGLVISFPVSFMSLNKKVKSKK